MKVYAILVGFSLLMSILFLGELKGHIKTKSKLEIAINTIEATKKKYELERDKHIKLQKKSAIVESNFSVTKQELESMKGKDKILIAKPRLVENKINISFDKFVQEMQCITGEKLKCE